MMKKMELGGALMCIALLVAGCGSPSEPTDRPAVAAPTAQPESARPRRIQSPRRQKTRPQRHQNRLRATPCRSKSPRHSLAQRHLPQPRRPPRRRLRRSSRWQHRHRLRSQPHRPLPSPLRRLLPSPHLLRRPPRHLCQRQPRRQLQPWWTRGVPSRLPRQNPDSALSETTTAKPATMCSSPRGPSPRTPPGSRRWIVKAVTARAASTRRMQS